MDMYAPCVRLSTWKTYAMGWHKTYMTDHDDLPIAAYLSMLRKRSGLSLDDVARSMGYKGRSSVQRYFEDEGLTVLRRPVLARMARAFYGKGSPPITLQDLERLTWGISGKPLEPTPDEIIARMLEITDLVYGDIYGNQHDSLEVEREKASDKIVVAGEAHATNWVEGPLDEAFVKDMLKMPFNSRSFRDDEYALRIVGTSVNRVAPEGTYAICRRFLDFEGDVPSEKFVHVERSKNDFREWTIKKVRWGSGGLLLWPDSTDPAHQEPISRGDNEHVVRILGVVIGWYRPG